MTVSVTRLRYIHLNRAQSERFGTQIFSETVNKIDLSKKPFKIFTDEKEVEAMSVIVATGNL